MPKGLPVYAYRDAAPIKRCLSTHHDLFILVGDELPELFEADDFNPALFVMSKHLCSGEVFNYCTPDPSKNLCSGGNFAYTCDSRFRELYPYPIPIFDMPPY